MVVPTNGSKQAVQRVKLADIDRRYMRKYFPPEKMNPLKDSIRRNGILVPGVLSARGVLVDGYCRLAVTDELHAEGVPGFDTFPVIVNEAIDSEEKELATLFNTETRNSRNPVDLGRHLQAFTKAHAIPTQKDLATALKLDPSVVSRVLSVFDYPDAVVEAVGHEVLTLAHISAVNALEDMDRKTELLRQAAEEGLSAAVLRKLAFPPKKTKPKVGTMKIGGLTISYPADMTVEQFEAACGQALEQLRAAQKDTSKKQFKVAELIVSVSVAK